METETSSSLWRRTGGMSLKDEGVDATMRWCSSGEMKEGRADMSVNAAIMGG